MGIREVVRFVVAIAALAAIAVAPNAVAAVSDTVGKTTLEQRVVPTGSGAYRFLQLGAGEPYTVRQDLERRERVAPPTAPRWSTSASSPTSSSPTRSRPPGSR